MNYGFFEWFGVVVSIASIVSLAIAIFYLPTLIHWRKVRKAYKQYVDLNLLQDNDKYFANFNSYYIKAKEEERSIIREATKYAPEFHKNVLRRIMNMIDNQEDIGNKKDVK